MRALTAAQMREVDRRTIESGIPGIILMENAGCRVVEFLSSVFAPLAQQRITVVCGKGNNGGDGLVIARQLHTRFHAAALHVVLAASPDQMRGDAADNARMPAAVGCPFVYEVDEDMRRSTLVVDAVLGTGLDGPATGRALELIQQINRGFPLAKVVAVDLPSGMLSDTGVCAGEFVRADYTVTFTAPKVCHVLAPACDNVGQWSVAQIGSPPELYADVRLALNGPAAFRHLFAPRARESNKGRYGHLLVIAGSPGKAGAAELAGVAALRAGAGLVTVTTQAANAPELMTEAIDEIEANLSRKNSVIMGPGLGTFPEAVALVRRVCAQVRLPMVLDADALNALAGQPIPSPAARILTPHPGEMARLTGRSIAQVQADRVGIAREFAQRHGVYLVLKGHRTAIAFPDGRVTINPTGTPALATAGTGDVLTGILGGLLAQFPDDIEAVVLAAVYLHGRAGEFGVAKYGEKSLLATDLYEFLPGAMDEVASLPDLV